MLLWDPAQVPQGMFDALSQRLEAFTDTQGDRFDIRGGQHQVIDQMREGLSGNAHTQAAHVGKIRLGAFAWGLHLFKDHLTLRPMQRAPPGDMAAQGDHLSRPVAVWMLLDEQGEQRPCLQRWIPLQLGHDPLPVLLKGILASEPGSGLLELRGPFSQPPILASRSFTHPCFSGGELLRRACFACLHIQRNLAILFHGLSPRCIHLSLRVILGSQTDGRPV